ncbi:MAG: hypothetical protein GEEBNDBF_00760 [bacterium]|nr:hypothetical protein [bacterium]
MKLNYIKGFVPLLIILLGVFVYVSRQDGKQGDRLVPLSERYQVTPPAVIMVEFTTEQGTMRAVREGDAWQMSQPGDFPGDTDTIETFVDALLALQPDRILEDLPPDKLTEFGLDQPAAMIQLSDDKQVLLKLALGSTTASASGYYAKVEKDGAILTLPSVQLNEQILNKDPNAFRSRQVFHIDREALARIEVESPTRGTHFTLEKQPDGWMMTAPIVHRAKERLIDATLIHFEDLKVDQFLPTRREQATEQSDYGLTVPDAIITLVNADGTRQQVSLGAPGGDLGKLYATSSDLPEVFLAQQHIADKVRWSEADLKEDRLVVFASDTIGSVEVRLRGADNLVLSRLADGTWSRTMPTPQSFGPDEITPLIKALVALAPQEYVPAEEAASIDESDLGFSEYTLKVELKKSDTFKSQMLTIGKLHRRRGFFTRDSLTPGIYLLPEAQVRDLEREIEAVRGGDAQKEAQQAWSEEQKKQAEENAKQAAAEEKKNKKKAKTAASKKK